MDQELKALKEKLWRNGSPTNIGWDFNGPILVNDFLVVFLSNYFLRRKYGKRGISLEEFKCSLSPSYYQFLSSVGAKKPDEEYTESYLRASKLLYFMPKIACGIEEVLKFSKRKGKSNLLITAHPTMLVEKQTKELGIDQYIDHKFTSIHDKVEEMPEITKRWMKPENSIYIGDTISDIMAARKARIPIAVVTYGYQSEEGLRAHKPDFIVHNACELEKIIA